MKKWGIAGILLLSLMVAGCTNHYQKGMSLIDQGQIDLAIEELLAALKEQPTNSDIYYRLGLLYLQKEEYRLAMNFFQQVIDRFPGHPELDGAYFYVGFCHFQLREYKPAIKAFSLLNTSFPGSQYGERAQFYQAGSAWYGEDYGKAVGYYVDLVRRFPHGNFYPMGMFQLGESHFAIGNYPEAIDAYTKFLEAVKNWQQPAELSARGDVNALSEHAIYRLGLGHVEIDEPGKAAEYFREILNTFPKSDRLPEVAYRLGKVYERLDKQQQALDMYQLVADFPDSEYADDALFRQATLQYGLEKYERAFAQYTRLINAYPNSPNLPRAYVMGGNCLLIAQQYEKAAHLYEQAFQQRVRPQEETVLPNEKTTDPALKRDAALWAAIAYYYADDFPKAQKMLSRLPEDGRTLQETYWAGELAYNLHQYDEAQQDFTRVLEGANDRSLLKLAYLGQLKVLYGQERWQDVLLRMENIPPELLSPEVFLIAGDCALNLKDFSQAMSFYQEIRDRSPQHPMAQDVLYYAGTAAYKLEKFAQARQFFTELFKQYPGHKYASDAQYYLGWTYFREDQYENAIREFQLLIERFPDSDLVMQAKLKIADSYFNMGLYAEALKQYQRIIEQHQDHPDIIGEAQYGTALVYKVTGKYEDYLKTTHEFIAENPDNPLSITAQYQIGEQFFQQGEYPDAITAYQWILDRVPDNEYADNALYRIGQSYLQEENLTHALRAFQHLLRQYPNSDYRPTAQYEIATIYFNLPDFAMAAKEYQTFIQSFPADSHIPQAMFSYGNCLLRLERLPEATKVFGQIIQRFPASPQAEEAGFLVGDILVQQGQCQEAEQAFVSVLSGTEQNRAARAQLKIAECYQHRSEFDRAISEYFKVIYVYSAQKSESDQATFASASIYEKQNKIDEARNLYKKLVETSTNAELVQQAQRKLQELQ